MIVPVPLVTKLANKDFTCNLLAFLVVCVFPIAIYPIVKIGLDQRKASYNLQNHMETLISQLSETIANVPIIKAYNLENYEKERSKYNFNQLFLRLIKLIVGRARVEPILEILGGIAISIVIISGAWRINYVDFSVGDFAGFITAMLLMVQPARGLGSFNSVVQEGIAATKRIYELIDQNNFTSPTLDRELNKDLTILNDKSIVLPLGEVKISRKVKSILVLFRTNSNVEIWDQNKKRLFELPKIEYTLRSLNSLIKSINFSKIKYPNINFKTIIVEDNSKKENISKIDELIAKNNIDIDNIPQRVKISIRNYQMMKKLAETTGAYFIFALQPSAYSWSKFPGNVSYLKNRIEEERINRIYMNRFAESLSKSSKSLILHC